MFWLMLAGWFIIGAVATFFLILDNEGKIIINHLFIIFIGGILGLATAFAVGIYYLVEKVASCKTGQRVILKKWWK